MYYTHILENKAGRLYIGQTDNREARLFRHNGNRVKATKNKGPWQIIYFKEFKTRAEAVHYELYLKSLKNPKYIKETIVKNIGV